MKAKVVDLKGFQQTPVSWLPFLDFAGDIEARWSRMNGVFDAILKDYKNPKILDTAAGGGGTIPYCWPVGVMMSRPTKSTANS